MTPRSAIMVHNVVSIWLIKIVYIVSMHNDIGYTFKLENPWNLYSEQSEKCIGFTSFSSEYIFRVVKVHKKFYAASY